MIELLVVIAIIAILASMLLPVLGKARDQSRTIACVNNLKQLSAAGTFYAGDNGDSLPYSGNAGVFTGVWISYFNYYVSGQLEAWSIHGKTAMVWRCPSEGSSYGVAGTTTGLSGPFQQPMFSINVHCTKPASETGYDMSSVKKLGQIKNPAKILLLADNRWRLGHTIELVNLQTRLAYRHGGDSQATGDMGGRANIAFIDGHIASLNFNQVRGWWPTDAVTYGSGQILYGYRFSGSTYSF